MQAWGHLASGFVAWFKVGFLFTSFIDASICAFNTHG